VSNRLAIWIKKQGIKDRALKPSHSTRKWYRSKAASMGLDRDVADALLGFRTDRIASRHYIEVDLVTRRALVEAMPTPGL
jgi:intergrase/recombinase